MGQNPTLFTSLPSDVLFWIFSECSVLDILSLSSVRRWPRWYPSFGGSDFIVFQTCKQLQQMADEYQVWSDQARHLEVPIPPGATLSKAELKDWAISRTRVDVCWTKPRPGELSLHLFEADTKFVDAHFIPGGEFIVILYMNGDIGLNKIERSASTGDLRVREVARYEDMTADDSPGSWSGLLTETYYGCPVLIWTGTVHWEE